MGKRESCADLVSANWDSRKADFIAMLEAYNNGEDATSEGECIYDYGLSFDFVKSETFGPEQKEYFRYQLSWGGPADEIRFYVGLNYQPYRIEYWYLDWFDGESIDLTEDEIAKNLWAFLSCDGDTDHLQAMVRES